MAMLHVTVTVQDMSTVSLPHVLVHHCDLLPYAPVLAFLQGIDIHTLALK